MADYSSNTVNPVNSSGQRNKASINIIGCGNLGRTLAKLWHLNKIAEIGQILNRTADSTQSALEYIGAGQSCDHFSLLNPATMWLIGTPDDAIESTALSLSQLEIDWNNAIVFHCSGAHTAEALSYLADKGAKCASIHPVHSFADPDASIKQLAGCFCSVEGDKYALEQIKPLFESLNLNCLAINPKLKLTYHAAAVFACNYLSTLLDASAQCLNNAGIKHEQPLHILMPLIRQTLDNIENIGPQKALSGPVKRAETDLIKRQWQALDHCDTDIAELYAAMAKQTLSLAGLASANPTAFNDLTQFLQSVTKST